MLLWMTLLTTGESLPTRYPRVSLTEPVECYLSLAPVWELAIKLGLGKLTLPGTRYGIVRIW